LKTAITLAQGEGAKIGPGVPVNEDVPATGRGLVC